MPPFLHYFLLVGIYVLWDTLNFTVLAKDLYASFYTEGISNWNAAAIVYTLYPLSIIYLTHSPSLEETVTKALVLGLTGYGLYNLTNVATFKAWPIDLAMWDTYAGTFITTLIAMLHWYSTGDLDATEKVTYT